MLVTASLEDHLKVQEGLRPASVRSYRDTLKLVLAHAAGRVRRPVPRLASADLGYERMLDFLDWIERDEIDVLLASLPASRPMATRDRAPVTCMYRC